MCVDRRRGVKGRPSRRKSDIFGLARVAGFWQSSHYDTSSKTARGTPLMPVVVIINSRVTKEIASGAASVGKTLAVPLVVLGMPGPWAQVPRKRGRGRSETRKRAAAPRTSSDFSRHRATGVSLFAILLVRASVRSK